MSGFGSEKSWRFKTVFVPTGTPTFSERLRPKALGSQDRRYLGPRLFCESGPRHHTRAGPTEALLAVAVQPRRGRPPPLISLVRDPSPSEAAQLPRAPDTQLHRMASNTFPCKRIVYSEREVPILMQNEVCDTIPILPRLRGVTLGCMSHSDDPRRTSNSEAG